MVASTIFVSRVESSARSHDEAGQARLWQVSEQLTLVSSRCAAWWTGYIGPY